ncbi:hypothetical protein [Agromyces sp. NPDC055658]
MDSTDRRRAELVTTRALALEGRDPRASSGELTRLRRGVFVNSETWRSAGHDERYLMRVSAVLETRRVDAVLCNVSAGVVWGLPIVGPHHGAVHLVAPERSGVRSKNGVTWHHEPVADEETVEHDGFLVTSFRRTVVDLVRALPFAAAVAVVDVALGAATMHPHHPALAGVSREHLLEAIEAIPGRRGVRSARIAVAFGDPRSGSPGESVSRANMHLLGYPAPELQVAFPRPGGGRDIVDFDWTEFGVFGEFDGRGKYVRPEYLKGRTTAEAVLLEKERENRVRHHRPFGARWDWTAAVRPPLLDAELRRAGLRPLRERR